MLPRQRYNCCGVSNCCCRAARKCPSEEKMQEQAQAAEAVEWRVSCTSWQTAVAGTESRRPRTKLTGDAAEGTRDRREHNTSENKSSFKWGSFHLSQRPFDYLPMHILNRQPPRHTHLLGGHRSYPCAYPRAQKSGAAVLLHLQSFEKRCRSSVS